ncbi:bifunctional protein PutA [Halomonas elongata]|uniref:Bifunctional protein PutA n=1 Tax=Halomonas elongata TaxID=2746 RepID=A0A1B8P5E5_HALEL|nr:bifunctional protein PutA [Halomonas elongata]
MLNANDMLDNATWRQELDTLFTKVSDHYVVDENAYVEELIKALGTDERDFARIADKTAELVREIREMDTAVDTIDELLQQYSLDTHEGLMLMCLAEAMLRIPDKATADALIEDKLGPADWKSYLGQSESWMVNASTWGLLMTGRVITMDKPQEGRPSGFINKMVNRMGEPVIRRAMVEAMKVMGKQFVLGRDVDEALKRSKPLFDQGYTYSYDMLGEAARTRDDAKRYFDDYANAIERVGKASARLSDKTPSPSVSIKLSALHPRYEFGRREQILEELVASTLELVRMARERDVAVTIDAEEVDRLELSLEVFRAVYEHDVCRGWGHFGLVVQAYAKRACRCCTTSTAWPRPRATRFRCAWSRAPTGTPRSRNPSSSASRAIRSIRARRPPTSPTWCARASCCRTPPAGESSRSSPPITPTPSAPSSKWPTRPIVPSSSSACTAWARPSMPPLSSVRPRALTAASMHRWAPTRTCCPTWSVACSRTGPTRPSSTSWSTPRCRWNRCACTPWKHCVITTPWPTRRSPSLGTSTARSDSIRGASTSISAVTTTR